MTSQICRKRSNSYLSYVFMSEIFKVKLCTHFPVNWLEIHEISFLYRLLISLNSKLFSTNPSESVERCVARSVKDASLVLLITQTYNISFLLSLGNIRNQADSAPLMTRAMRELREESEMYKYDRVRTLIPKLVLKDLKFWLKQNDRLVPFQKLLKR